MKSKSFDAAPFEPHPVHPENPVHPVKRIPSRQLVLVTRRRNSFNEFASAALSGLRGCLRSSARTPG